MGIHASYEMVHCGILDGWFVEFVRQVYWRDDFHRETLRLSIVCFHIARELS